MQPNPENKAETIVTTPESTMMKMDSIKKSDSHLLLLGTITPTLLKHVRQKQMHTFTYKLYYPQ